jgi:protein O-GlcNAc transferase
MSASISEQLTAAMQRQQAGQFAEAEALCMNVLAQAPGQLDALQMLAAGKFMRGLHDEALRVINEALDHHADNFELNVLAGHSRRALGELEQTAAHYARAVAARPDLGEGHIMLGWTLRVLDRREEAMAHYREALRINPDLVEAYNNLGVMHHDAGELEPAMEYYRAVLTRQPGHIDARRNLCAALRASKRFAEALDEFENILKFDPNYSYAELMAMHSKRELCRWQDFDRMTARAREIATLNTGAYSPFLLVSWDVDPAHQLQAARAYAAKAAPPMRPVPATPRASDGKLRIGYFSADFRDHVVSAVVPEVFELHDRTAFEVIGYSYGPDDASPQRRRIQNACSVFHDLRHLSDDTAARRIKEDGIDILVDLTAFTGGIRHGIPMRRPAPVQMNWLGYPGTSGSPAIDYLVADAFTIPEGAEHYYSEKIIRLPGSSQPHDRTRAIAKPLARKDYGLPESGFVFCSFNHTQKLTPQIFGSWMDLLARIPGSALWLRADQEEAMANLRRTAQAAGVDPARIIPAPHTANIAEHLARYRVADLALDTFPYNSHTTANDALWLGCPLVTLTGNTFASRVAGGILHALGLPELVTNSLQTYQDTAYVLATQPDVYANVKSKLAAARASSPAFDTTRFTRNLEAGYRAAWHIRASGEAARHIMVGSDA